MTGPRVPRTDFSTVMHSREPCVSPLLVQTEMGCPPRINLITLTGVRHSVLQGATVFASGCRGAVWVPEPPHDAWLLSGLCPDPDTARTRAHSCISRKDSPRFWVQLS